MKRAVVGALMLGAFAIGAMFLKLDRQSPTPRVVQAADTSPTQEGRSGTDDLERSIRSLMAKVTRLEDVLFDRDAAAIAQAESKLDPPETVARAVAEERERSEARFNTVSNDFQNEATGEDDESKEAELFRSITAAIPGLSPNVQCRSTLCRIEVRKEDPNADMDLSALYDAGGFQDGGMAHTFDDGTVVLFAGRPGYSFQELHAHN